MQLNAATPCPLAHGRVLELGTRPSRRRPDTEGAVDDSRLGRDLERGLAECWLIDCEA